MIYSLDYTKGRRVKQQILIVEDEPDIREVISYNLTQAGLEPVSSADGETALQ